MPVIFLFSALIILLYIALILWFYKGWNKIPVFRGISSGKTSVSVIIPFRNEETNISALLTALKSQTYPHESWEVIFVDDHSVDNSCELIRSGFPDAGIIHLPPDISGKKKALEFGAVNAKNDLLLFTDADCIPGKDWINTMVSYYEFRFPVLISGPVIMDPGNSFLSKFQALEFLSLTGTGAASFGNNNPIMANGANLAVRRDVYLDNLENRMNSVSSGDDIFLILSLKNRYQGKTVFLKSRDAMVTTFPMPDLKEFIQQRLRWVSKSRYYNDKWIILTAVLVLMINLWLLFCVVSGFFISEFFIIWGATFIMKSFGDYLLLKKVTGFTGQGHLLRNFVLSQFVYFLYISFAGIVGNLIKVKWKERKIKV